MTRTHDLLITKQIVRRAAEDIAELVDCFDIKPAGLRLIMADGLAVFVQPCSKVFLPPPSLIPQFPDSIHFDHPLYAVVEIIQYFPSLFSDCYKS